MRSPEFATDEANCEDAVDEMAKFATQKQYCDYFCRLQPTSPFCKTADLGMAIELLESTPTAMTLVSSREVYRSSYSIQYDGKFLDVFGCRLWKKAS